MHFIQQDGRRVEIKSMEWEENDGYSLFKGVLSTNIIQKFDLIPLTSEMPQNNIKSMHSKSNYESIISNWNYATAGGGGI